MGLWYDIVAAEHIVVTDHDMMKQTISLMFKDPYNQAQFVKSQTSVLKQLAFSRSTAGNIIKWSPMSKKDDPLFGFTCARIENDGVLVNGKKIPFNDEAYYGVTSVKVREALTELRTAGYTLLADTFERLISAEVTDAALSSLGVLNSIEAIVGFTRGDKIESYKKQIAKTGTKPANPGYIPEMEMVITDFVDWAVLNRRFPTSEEWFQRLHTALNSNSAGGPRAEYSVKLDGKDFDFIATDKTLVFISDPWKYISEDEFEKALTSLFPGGITSRDVVGGRDTRAVWMIALVVYLYETAWGYTELEYLTRAVDFASFGEVGLDAHKKYIYNTSVWNIVNVLKDFSSYDTTQEWENARGPFAKLMVEAMNRQGMRDKIGDLGSIPEVYLKVAHKLRDAVFNLGDGTLVNPQQTHSGELNTANRNTFLNKAEDDYEERVIDERYPHVREVIGSALNTAL
jgi:hypothetical protein